MRDALSDFTGTVRRAVDDYRMIQAGDRVAVGVSGGKDSMVLLLALNCLRQYYPEPFELEAVTIELGFEGMDFTPVRELCGKLDIPYTCVKTDIKEIVFDVRFCTACCRGAMWVARTGAAGRSAKEPRLQGVELEPDAVRGLLELSRRSRIS